MGPPTGGLVIGNGRFAGATQVKCLPQKSGMSVGKIGAKKGSIDDAFSVQLECRTGRRYVLSAFRDTRCLRFGESRKLAPTSMRIRRRIEIEIKLLEERNVRVIRSPQN